MENAEKYVPSEEDVENAKVTEDELGSLNRTMGRRETEFLEQLMHYRGRMRDAVSTYVGMLQFEKKFG